MARFSETRKGSQKTTNYEGAEAYKLTPELELYSAVCTASLQPKFYGPRGGVSDELTRIRKLVQKCDAEFVAKLAVYAREKMYLRSVPLVLAVELELKDNRSSALVSKLTERVIQRADELYEVLAYFGQANKRSNGIKPVPRALLRGVSGAFGKFDEYQFAKYRGEGKGLTLRDAMFLSRPKPARGRKKLYERIAEDELETPLTWEVELSKGGDKKEAWEKLIESRKLPYMASLRNLRNMTQAGISQEHMDSVCAFLANPEMVRKSRQLPFRFLAAYRELEETAGFYFPYIAKALEAAAKAAAANIQGFDRDTAVLIAGDMSGSMQGRMAERSTMQYYEVGLILASMLQSHCAKVLTGIFGERWDTVQVPHDNILANARTFSKMLGRVGHSTNGWKVISWAAKENIGFDKMIFFTDCQWWDSGWGASRSAAVEWANYKQKFPQAKAYYFDLAGYGNTPLSTTDNDVYLIAGWSEKVFEVLAAIERGESALSEVQKIEL